jgi:predicted Zn finger-like uncharacterized protein
MYYTQCPQCQVYFRITVQQLAARQGLVRCGKCGTAFRADERLFDKLPKKKTHAERAKSAEGRTTRRRTAAARAPAQAETLPLFAAPERSPGGLRALWVAASVALLVALAGQLAYLHRVELGAQPALREYVAAYCDWLGCDFEPPPDVNRIELETSIAPHPKFQNALRLRAELINRAEYTQPFPRMEVALTDSDGRVLARRAFSAAQYLGHTVAEAATAPSLARGPHLGPISDEEMNPNIAHHALLDLTNPDNRAVGYEVRLLPAK